MTSFGIDMCGQSLNARTWHKLCQFKTIGLDIHIIGFAVDIVFCQSFKNDIILLLDEHLCLCIGLAI